MFRILLLSIILLCSQGFSELLTEEKTPLPPFASLLILFDISPDNSADTIAKMLVEKCFQKNDRWTFESRFEDMEDLLHPLFEEIGCFETVQASQEHYDYAVILGSLRSGVEYRIEFLLQEWERGVRFDQVILLTGARPLLPKEGCPNLQSEAEMMEFVWHQTEMPSELKQLPLVVANAPPAPHRDRADTQGTIATWLEKNPTPGTCLFFSSQPFVGYQDAVLRARMPVSFSIETVGPTGGSKLSPAILMDTLTKWYVYEFPYLVPLLQN